MVKVIKDREGMKRTYENIFFAPEIDTLIVVDG